MLSENIKAQLDSIIKEAGCLNVFEYLVETDEGDLMFNLINLIIPSIVETLENMDDRELSNLSYCIDDSLAKRLIDAIKQYH